MNAHARLLLKKEAMLASANRFFLPSNFDVTKVLAAYQFKGATNLDTAKVDLSGHGYTLTVSSGAGYSDATGFSTGTITCSSLASVSNTIKTAIICYSGYSKLSDPSTGGMIYLTHMKAPVIALYLQLSFKTHDQEEWVEYGNGRIGLFKYVERGSNTSGNYTHAKFLTTTKTAPSSGVLAMEYTTNTQKLFFDGTQITATNHEPTGWGTGTWPGTNCRYSDGSNPVVLSDSNHNINIWAAAFYTDTLTAAQHLEVVNMMKAL